MKFFLKLITYCAFGMQATLLLLLLGCPRGDIQGIEFPTVEAPSGVEDDKVRVLSLQELGGRFSPARNLDECISLFGGNCEDATRSHQSAMWSVVEDAVYVRWKGCEYVSTNAAEGFTWFQSVVAIEIDEHMSLTVWVRGPNVCG